MTLSLYLTSPPFVCVLKLFCPPDDKFLSIAQHETICSRSKKRDNGLTSVHECATHAQARALNIAEKFSASIPNRLDFSMHFARKFSASIT